MASIFLSYAREDSLKAKALARCLERAGHKVWWDRHIHGGSEFAGEIEAALKEAEVVLVLWSQASLRSAWVRDEAAEGRDSARLVPIILDDSAPPLGFRQLQSISINGWPGRGNPPNWQEILEAVAARSLAKTKSARAADQPTVSAETRKPMTVGLSALAALLLAIGAWWLLEGRGKAAEPPVLAVLPFSDLSPERDKAYFAEGVAEAILSILAKEPGIRVVGRSTARQLQDAGSQAGKMRRELGITHILEGSARSVGDQLRMSVRLIDASDGKQLWAEEYQRRLDNIFAVQDDIGRAVAQRLKGSFFSAASAPQQLTSADAYTLYLAARAKVRDRRLASLEEALEMSKQVIAMDPNYARGHALYAELIWHMSVDNYGTIPLERARELAMPHARRAVQLDPNASEGHAALGVVSTGEAAVASLMKAIRLDPSRSELRLWAARRMELLGRNIEGLKQLEAATAMDPLFAPAMWNHAWWLAASRRFDEAEKVIANYEQRGGSAAVAARTRADIAGEFQGDYSEAIRLAEQALRADPQTPLIRQTLSWSYDRVGLHADAVRIARESPLYTRLWLAGEYQQLRERAQKDGVRLWKQPDSFVAIYALMQARDWAALERLFDDNPDQRTLCEATSRFLPSTFSMAVALKARSRTAESTTLLNCVKRAIALHGREPVRSQHAPAIVQDIALANVRALEGRQAEAFQLLNRAIARGARTSIGIGMSAYPAFDRYRSSPQYDAADRRLKELIAADRAEVLRMRQSQRRAA